MAQRQRSKDSAKAVDLEMGGVLAGLASDLESTVFSGYHDLEGTSEVLAILKEGNLVESVSRGVSLYPLLPKSQVYSLQNTAL